MDEKKTYELSGKFVVRKIVDEFILVPVSPELKQRDTLLVLNETAARMLEAMKEKKTMAEIEAQLRAEFDTEGADIGADFSALVNTLVAAEAIRELQPAN